MINIPVATNISSKFDVSPLYYTPTVCYPQVTATARCQKIFNQSLAGDQNI
jgi:hypothetical protein